MHKLCPFCGSQGMHIGGGNSSRGPLPHYIQCSSMICPLIVRTFEHSSKESAWDTWDKRFLDEKTKGEAL